MMKLPLSKTTKKWVLAKKDLEKLKAAVTHEACNAKYHETDGVYDSIRACVDKTIDENTPQKIKNGDDATLTPNVVIRIVIPNKILKELAGAD